jgi:transcriptional regulator with XRE-family HTH domain
MNKEETRTRIGQRVKALRLMADLSQDELAQSAGLQRTHIGRIEGGKYAVNIETLQAIAEALGMTVDIIDTGLQDLAPLKRLTP